MQNHLNSVAINKTKKPSILIHISAYLTLIIGILLGCANSANASEKSRQILSHGNEVLINLYYDGVAQKQIKLHKQERVTASKAKMFQRYTQALSAVKSSKTYHEQA